MNRPLEVEEGKVTGSGAATAGQAAPAAGTEVVPMEAEAKVLASKAVVEGSQKVGSVRPEGGKEVAVAATVAAVLVVAATAGELGRLVSAMGSCNQCSSTRGDPPSRCLPC